MKSYRVFDHLGSLRVEGIGVGNDMQSYYDYKPFGGLEASGTNQPFSKAKTRLGYVDMPKDKESNLGDHGVRKYDSEVGRFLAIDPLWEKYHTLNPFQYSANSPVMMLDKNGLYSDINSFYFQKMLNEQADVLTQLDNSLTSLKDDIVSTVSNAYECFKNEYLPDAYGFRAGYSHLYKNAYTDISINFTALKLKDGSILKFSFGPDATYGAGNARGGEFSIVMGFYGSSEGKILDIGNYVEITKNQKYDASVSYNRIVLGVTTFENPTTFYGEMKLGLTGDKGFGFSSSLPILNFDNYLGGK